MSPSKTSLVAQMQILEVCKAIYEAVSAAGPAGCPAGTVYAALMQHGCTLEQYERLEALCLRSGILTKKGDLLFAVAKENV